MVSVLPIFISSISSPPLFLKFVSIPAISCYVSPPEAGAPSSPQLSQASLSTVTAGGWTHTAHGTRSRRSQQTAVPHPATRVELMTLEIPVSWNSSGCTAALSISRVLCIFFWFPSANFRIPSFVVCGRWIFPLARDSLLLSFKLSAAAQKRNHAKYMIHIKYLCQIVSLTRFILMQYFQSTILIDYRL